MSDQPEPLGRSDSYRPWHPVAVEGGLGGQTTAALAETENIAMWAGDATVQWVIDWLRGDAGEQVRIQAEALEVPPEDALAHQLERLLLEQTTPSGVVVTDEMRAMSDHRGEEFLALEQAVRDDAPGLDHGTVAQSVAESMGLPTEIDRDFNEIRVYVRGRVGAGTYLRRAAPLLEQRWVRWADARADVHMKRASTCVAPTWLYARTPLIGLRMLVSGAVRGWVRRHA